MKIVEVTVSTDNDGKTKATLKSKDNTLVVEFDAKHPDHEKLVNALARAFGKIKAADDADAPLLRIGALVRVADTGKLYRNYTQWALDNLKSDQLVAFGVGSTLDWTNKEGEVVAIARHSINNIKWLVAVEVENKDTKRKAIGIFAAEGLEVLA